MEELKMAYRKFDDAPLSRANESKKVDPVMPWEAIRGALQGVFNRVVSGTDGTMGGTAGIGAAWLGTGSTCGIKLKTGLALIINGRLGTCNANNNLYLPPGTQSKSTYVKYLVSSGFGDTGTVSLGNEGATSTAAKLPNCPDGHVALGYMEYATGTAGAFIRIGGGTAGNSQNVISGNAGATCGTVNAYVQLMHMPMSEV
jgi:hypothetical protein